MTRVSPLETMILLFGLTLLAGLGALMLLASAAQTVTVPTVHQASTGTAAVPNWLDGRQTGIEVGLAVSPHAARHAAETLDASRIYKMLIEGKCAAAAQYCNGDGRRLYLCFDPVSGLLGGLFIQDGMIESGWGSRASYWAAKVRGEDAPFKPDKCYQH